MNLRSLLLSSALAALLASGSAFADKPAGGNAPLLSGVGEAAATPAGTPTDFFEVDISNQESPSILCNATGAGLPFINVDLGSNATVTGLGWDVILETFGGSWAQEAQLSFGTTTTPILVNLRVGAGNAAPTPVGGTAFASPGIIDLSDNAIPNIVLDADGFLRISFCETFNDNANPDAIYRPVSTLTIACFDCQSGTPGVAVTPDTINFGTQLLGTTSAAQGATFTNTGAADGEFTWSAASAPFAITGSTCGGQPATLAPGASCTLNYTFTPNLIVEQSQTITVSVAGGDPATASFVLRGTGIQPQGVAVPSLNVWGGALLLGALALAGLFGLRRRGSM